MYSIKNSKGFILPTRDIVFKTMWLKGDKMVRKYLERMVEYSLGHSLKDYKIGANELGIISIESIQNKVDILLISNDETEKTNIEMNRIIDSHGSKTIDSIMNKSDIYLSNFVSSFYDSKSINERYNYPIKVEQVNFNTFHCKDNKLIARLDFEFFDKNYNISKDGVKSHHIYLPRMRELCYNEPEKDIFKDFALLMCESYQEMEYYASGNKERMEVIKFLKKLSGDEEFMAVIDLEEYREILAQNQLEDAKDFGHKQGIEQGIEQGILKGIEQGKREQLITSAIKLYKNGVSKELIVSSLDITMDELEELISNNESK